MHSVTSNIDRDIMSKLFVISCLSILLSSKLSLTSPVGPSLNSGTAGAAAAAIAGAAIIAKVAEDECDDVGVSNSLMFT